jgi:hypothetical protein
MLRDERSAVLIPGKATDFSLLQNAQGSGALVVITQVAAVGSNFGEHYQIL